MFAAPPETEATVFARLPEEFRGTGHESGWTPGSVRLHSFLEAPAFDRKGFLYVADVPHGRIFRIAPDSSWSLAAQYDGWPNGMKIHRDGRIFITDQKQGIMILEPRTGVVKPALTHVRREGLKGVNDLIFASNGDIYFTDQGQTGMQDPTGRVYRWREGGAVDLLVDRMPSPNGIVLSADERTLLVAATRGNQIWRLPLHADGTTTKVGVFIQLSGGLNGPDGLALDESGNLAIAHCGMGTVWLFSRLGEPILRIRTPAGMLPTNLAFGGEDRRELFITEAESGSVLRVTLRVAGQSLFSHASSADG